MKRRGRLILAGGILAAAALLAAVFRSRPPEKFPLAEAVPANALFYAGFLMVLNLIIDVAYTRLDPRVELA